MVLSFRVMTRILIPGKHRGHMNSRSRRSFGELLAQASLLTAAIAASILLGEIQAARGRWSADSWSLSSWVLLELAGLLRLDGPFRRPGA